MTHGHVALCGLEHRQTTTRFLIGPPEEYIHGHTLSIMLAHIIPTRHSFILLWDIPRHYQLAVSTGTVRPQIVLMDVASQGGYFSFKSGLLRAAVGLAFSAVHAHSGLLPTAHWHLTRMRFELERRRPMGIRIHFTLQFQSGNRTQYLRPRRNFR